MMLTRLFLIAFLAFAGPLLAHANGHTNVQSVFLILMENVTWSEIKGSANAPFINSVLLPMASYCDNFFTAPNTSGSLPQYLWLEAARTSVSTTAPTLAPITCPPPTTWSRSWNALVFRGKLTRKISTARIAP